MPDGTYACATPDKLLDQTGIRAALANRGLVLTPHQVERAVIRHKNGTRRIPVVPCPITGKLVILESDLQKWFESVYRGAVFGTNLAQGDSCQKSESMESKGYGAVKNGDSRGKRRL